MKSIKDEIEEELREDVKEELKTELRDDIKTKMKAEITEEIQNVKTDDTKESSKKKTLYDDGLYRLIKDNLTKAEAIEIEGDIENGVYGRSSYWYTKQEENNTLSVWQRVIDQWNLSSKKIAELKRSADIVVNKDGEEMEEMNEIDKKTITEIKKSISKIEHYSLSNKNMLWVLGGAIGFLYTIGGGLYLKHIVHVSNDMLLVYMLLVVLVTILLLWLQCEYRDCDLF